MASRLYQLVIEVYRFFSGSDPVTLNPDPGTDPGFSVHPDPDFDGQKIKQIHTGKHPNF